MLVVKRAGRTFGGESREVGEVVPDADLDWYHRKALIESHTAEPFPDFAEPVECGCGRRWSTEEAMREAGHDHEASGDLEELTRGELLKVAEEEHGLPEEAIEGTGRDGYVKKTDILEAIGG